MCNKGYEVIFKEFGCEIRKVGIRRLVTKGMRTNGNVYYAKDNNGSNCLLAQVCGEWNQIEIAPNNKVIIFIVDEEKAPEIKFWIKMVEEDLNQIEEC